MEFNVKTRRAQMTLVLMVENVTSMGQRMAATAFPGIDKIVRSLHAQTVHVKTVEHAPSMEVKLLVPVHRDMAERSVRILHVHLTRVKIQELVRLKKDLTTVFANQTFLEKTVKKMSAPPDLV